MTREEVRRRITALIALPKEKRPITTWKLAQLAGGHFQDIYAIAKGAYLGKDRAAQYAKVLELVEGDQIEVRNKKGIRGNVHIVTVRADPRPRQLRVQQVHFTNEGPKIRTLTVNPGAFPVLPGIDSRRKKA
jgi:hypothetical protein